MAVTVTGCTIGHQWKTASPAEKIELVSEHLVDAVDASDQQATEIKNILEKFEPDLTLMHANHQNHKASLLSVLKQEKVSETDLESARRDLFELLNQDAIELTKMVAEKIGYEFSTIGSKSSRDRVVNINAFEMPAFDVLQELGWQAGRRTGIHVDEEAETIKITYEGN